MFPVASTAMFDSAPVANSGDVTERIGCFIPGIEAAGATERVVSCIP
ncbi:MAG TPA: hypothetical protein VGI39_37795 [Polyangiaceae bacterium]